MPVDAVKSQNNRLPRFSLTLDAWAVAIALGLAGLVRAGVLKHIPW